VTRERDRMGLRLDGPRLAHVEGGADIVSDGVAPGAIQVPADGRPIVLLADCQTVGGYPKIAVVIRADLPRLAHLQTGDGLGFAFVDAAQAAAARAAQARQLADWLAALQPLGGIDEASLLSANLAGAAVRGDEA
jgi:allophanate hydrolase subunit 2